MRLPHLSVFVLLTAAVPAYAGSDSSDAPNPFADQPATAGNITTVDKGVGDFSAPVQPPATQPAQGKDFITPNDQSPKSGSSGDFYQSSKKDTGGQ